jgi:glycosyltransferase involved in cell wall biosynthesis
LYLSADALVLPSYHEGYCVPAVEALWAGCFPITFDSSNLPHVTGGLGTLVPTGSVDAFRAAVFDFVDRIDSARRQGHQVLLPTSARGDMAESDWRQRVRSHLRDYSPAAYESGFVDLLARFGLSKYETAVVPVAARRIAG